MFLKRKQLADTLCTHMIALPIADLLLGLVNLRSFYIHSGENTAGFKFTTSFVVLDLLLLMVTIHEERYLPLRLKDETVRVQDCIMIYGLLIHMVGSRDDLSLRRIEHHFIPGSCSLISTR